MPHGAWLKLAVSYRSVITTDKIIQLSYTMVESNADLLEMIPRQYMLEHPWTSPRALR